MKKREKQNQFNPINERIKYQYLCYLKRVLRKDEKTTFKVLELAAFNVCSPWSLNNLFEKGGELFKICHPVWLMDESKAKFIGVRLEKYNLPI